MKLLGTYLAAAFPLSDVLVPAASQTIPPQTPKTTLAKKEPSAGLW
jgi:hypothetical protein